jgi:hypothetical protein
MPTNVDRSERPTASSRYAELENCLTVARRLASNIGDGDLDDQIGQLLEVITERRRRSQRSA